MLLERMLRKSSTGPGAALGGALTLESAAGWDGWTEDTVAMSRDKAMKHSVVARCVEVRSTVMAMLPLYIMNEHTKERYSSHPLGQLLWSQANEAMTRIDYERLMQANMDLKGNAYAWINHHPANGRPVELIPLAPDHVTPWVTGDGCLHYIWVNPRTGQMFKLDQADVIHYKGYTTDGINGVSILSRAAQTVKTGLLAQRYQMDLFQNGGRPSGVLTVDTDLGGQVEVTNAKGETETISMKEKVRREWDKVHTGGGNGFRVAVLDHGLKYAPIAMSNADAQFVESEEVRIADVARFFAVPLHLLYAGKQSYASNEQNSLEFVKFTLQPLVVQREQEDTRKLLLPREQEHGDRIRRELKALLRGDTATQASWYKAMREIGAYDVDEIRALEDLGKVPGGTTRYSSLNYVPLEDFSELSRLRAERQTGTSEAAESQ